MIIFIYFGGEEIYKYNIAEDNYETLTVDNPPQFFGSSITSIGTDIYIVGSFVAPSSQRELYKFDTLTNTSTNLGDLPVDLAYGDCVSIGNMIYIFSSLYVYKYNVNTNEYTRLSNIPQNMRGVKICTDGIDIYLFGCFNNKYAYKYIVSTDTYTQLDNVPYDTTSCRCIGIGSNMYIFGGDSDTDDAYKCYKYDTISNTYIQLDNIPTKYSGGALALVNSSDKYSFYLFGGYAEPTKLQIYNIPIKTFNENSIIIDQSTSLYKTQMYSNENIIGRLLYSFNNVYYNTTENGLDDTLPTYYGDGTQWIKFKN